MGTAVVVDDATRTVSRTHAVVRLVNGVPHVEDLGSANGTRIERAGHMIACAVGSPVEMGHGDVLFLGHARLEIRGVAHAR